MKRLYKYKIKELQQNNQRYLTKLRSNPTKAELIVKEFLEDWGVKFIFQKGFLTPFHRIVDFYIPAGGIIIEVDGNSHDKTKRLDWAKDNFWCDDRGMTTIRITNDDVYNGVFKEKLASHLFLSGVSL